jgi:small subunit ribosomal protein S16
MATKIRLQRHGRKGYAFYHIVIADSRAPRDGKFIERIGSYNPNTNPATIDLKFDRALYWLQVGAQPTDTTRNILSDQGVLLKKHLLGGVQKGAFTETEAETKFQAWLDAKQGNIKAEVSKLSEAQKVAEKNKLEAEKAVNKAKAEALAAKKAELIAASRKAAAEAEAKEIPAEEAPAEEPIETPAAEVPVVEAPVDEAPVEEAPAAEEVPAAE